MTEVRTSTTHPLRVDFVDSAELKLPGRLGLTFAPGKKQRDALTGSWDRGLGTDLRALREQAPRFGMEVLWFPIRDGSVPTSLPEFHEAVGRIAGYLRSGRTTVIHC